MEYSLQLVKEHIEDQESEPFIAIKLPTVSHDFSQLKSLSRLKILWMIRDPRDVLLSMTKLKLNTGSEGVVPWVTHHFGAINEIDHALASLTPLSDQSARYVARYHQIKSKPSQHWSHTEKMFIGGFCWRLKHKVLALYANKGISYKLVRYEELVAQPQETLSNIMNFLPLDWHDNLLMHHQLHTGVSVGDTLNTRAIDRSNVEKWKGEMGQTELDISIGSVRM